MEAEVLECLCILVARSYNDITDWVILLKDASIISRDEKTVLLKYLQDDGESKALKESCLIVLKKTLDQQLSIFQDEDFPKSVKRVDIIVKLLQDGRVSWPISYLMKSWNRFEESEQIRSAATSYCTCLSETNWMLDVIHHMAITEKPHLQEEFAKKAQEILQPDPTHGDCPTDLNDGQNHSGVEGKSSDDVQSDEKLKESELLEYLSILVLKSYEKLPDWINFLKDLDIIKRDEKRIFQDSLRNDERLKVLNESCKAVLTKTLEQQILVFQDKDFQGDARLVDITMNLLQDRHLKWPILYLIKSWDKLEGSDEIRSLAMTYCASLSETNWMLDFIHHMLTATDSILQEGFAEKAKEILETCFTDEDFPSNSSDRQLAMEGDQQSCDNDKVQGHHDLSISEDTNVVTEPTSSSVVLKSHERSDPTLSRKQTDGNSDPTDHSLPATSVREVDHTEIKMTHSYQPAVIMGDSTGLKVD